jgi:hypothetical protein
MKRFLITLLAFAAITAACTKEETTYTESYEIGFRPVPEKLTKGAMFPADGETLAPLPQDQEMGIFAYRKSDEAPTQTPSYNNRETYLNNATFAWKQVSVGESVIEAWGGKNASYPWPLNGSLVFAGYNKPKDAVINASFDLASNTMTFTDYVQSNNKDNTFDLCWFGRTASSYNNRVSGAAIDVTLEHALSWITIKVKVDGNIVSPWIITNMYFSELVVESTGTCKTSSIEWSVPDSNKPDSKKDMYLIDNEEFSITNNSKICGGTDESPDPGIVVIPQVPVILKVEFKRSKTSDPEVKDVPLYLDSEMTQKWQAGKHYVYTLVFKANEILVAPSFGEWGNGTDKTIIVE